MIPVLSDIAEIYFSPGMGLRDSAIVSFLLTIVVMVVFALVSGDGLLGEIQFVLGAFFSFFVIIWLLIAWIF